MRTAQQIQDIALYHIVSPGMPANYANIAIALKKGLTVMASLASGSDLVVRNVRHDDSSVQVLTLEGWRTPLRIWTKEQPELPFHVQVRDEKRTLLQ